MFKYPVKLELDEVSGTYMVSCRDLPLMNSVGENVDEALLEAIEGIVAAISLEIDERRPVPVGSVPKDGEFLVSAPLLVALKASLHNAMIETGTRKADLARKMGKPPQQIERLMDVQHSSKVETVERALHLLNREISVSITKDH